MAVQEWFDPNKNPDKYLTMYMIVDISVKGVVKVKLTIIDDTKLSWKVVKQS